MFDIGWSEMAVIALIALLVIGPKELPRTMKAVAHWMRKARSLTREFQSGIDEMVREAELEDAKKALDATRGGNLQKTLANAIDPTGDVTEEVREIEREARRDDHGRDDLSGAAAGSAAAMMSKPAANVAPAHSLTPPAETPAPKAAADSNDPAPAPQPAAEPAPSVEPGPSVKEDSKQSA